MLSHLRSNTLDDLGWSQNDGTGKCWDCITTLECWKYEGIDRAKPNVNFLVRTLADQARDPRVRHGEVEERLEQWLAGTEPYEAPEKPPGAGELQGCMRVVLCERDSGFSCPSMSREAYEAVEHAFKLHGSVLPTFRLSDGVNAHFVTQKDSDGEVEAVDILIRSRGKVEVSNGLMALHYDVKRHCTTAWVCGSGAVRDTPIADDEREIGIFPYGRDIAGNRDKDSQLRMNQLAQLKAAISSSPELWDHPLLLPAAILHIYHIRTHVRTRILDMKMIKLENLIGVTNAGGSHASELSEHWPLDINPKSMMVKLVSMLPEAIFMARTSDWLLDFAMFLDSLSIELAKQPGLVHLKDGFNQVRDSARYFTSVSNGQKSFFLSLKDRASWQMNLLLSIIGQQDSVHSLWQSRLSRLTAEATKQDSISVATFTFITALFLPGTFVATLFSMSMFDWSTGTDSGTSSSSSYVSDKFWVFWITAVPLTAITMLGWWIWYQNAIKKWEKVINKEKQRRDRPLFLFESYVK